MQEDLLHYVWKHQRFSNSALLTAENENVEVLQPGIHNHNQGPDFLEAKIKIGKIQWVGPVEIHVRSSDWNKHKHTGDSNYENVVLHVVWKNDLDIFRPDGTRIPTIEFKGNLPLSVISGYEALVKSLAHIPCAPLLESVPMVVKISAMDSALVTRLETKSKLVLEELEKCNNDWEEVCQRMLMKNFGFKVNQDSFLRLASIIPHKILAKYSNRLDQIEALLFGTAGLILNQEDEYAKKLKKEFLYLQKLHGISSVLNIAEWKFSRMRPANFPTIRLAQVAALLQKNPNLFQSLIQSSPKDIYRIFDISASSYWESHSKFGVPRKPASVNLGSTSIDLVLINTVAPLLAAYSQSLDDQSYMDKAVDLLNGVKAEENAIIRKWGSLNLKCKSAAESQGLIQLFNDQCQAKKCLNCAIGHNILSNAPQL